MTVVIYARLLELAQRSDLGSDGYSEHCLLVGSNPTPGTRSFQLWLFLIKLTPVSKLARRGSLQMGVSGESYFEGSNPSWGTIAGIVQQ